MADAQEQAVVNAIRRGTAAVQEDQRLAGLVGTIFAGIDAFPDKVYRLSNTILQANPKADVSAAGASLQAISACQSATIPLRHHFETGIHDPAYVRRQIQRVLGHLDRVNEEVMPLASAAEAIIRQAPQLR